MNIVDSFQPVISHWTNASCGLDALLDPWNVVLGVAIVALSMILGILYLINNIDDEVLYSRCRRNLGYVSGIFLVLFLIFLIHILLKDGYAYDPISGVIMLEPMKYLYNFIEMWPLLIIFLVGVALLLYGIIRTIMQSGFERGIWFVGIGVVMVVLVLFLIVGWNNTAYYPSNADLQSSLTIVNSSSSEFTLRTMFVVSLLVPFVLAYIVYAWRSIDKKKIDRSEISRGDVY